MPTVDSIFERIENTIEPSEGYKSALKGLNGLPKGYSLCFAFHYVDADICNGGIGQLYANSTWSLVPTAVEACQNAGCPKLEALLREIVFYYHERGRSKLKRQIGGSFFNGLSKPFVKAIAELEDEYFALEGERVRVVPSLAAKTGSGLWE